jgi:ribokinase
VGRHPLPGETVLATHTMRVPGGKGANQAVAAARAGAPTTLLAALGDDADAQLLRAALHAAAVGTELVRTSAEPTGLAVVVVDPSGQNSIVVAPGANATLTGLGERERAAIRTAAVLLCQLEVPLAAVADAASVAHAAGVRVLVNAAPSRPLPDELCQAIDVLIVNEHEAANLTGQSEVGGAVEALLDRVPSVVVTLGGDGARFADRAGHGLHMPAPAVGVVDTTAAGDTFSGVLAAGLAGGRSMAHALGRAVAAASLSVQRHGAIPSIPTADEIDAMYHG